MFNSLPLQTIIYRCCSASIHGICGFVHTFTTLFLVVVVVVLFCLLAILFKWTANGIKAIERRAR